MLSIYVESKDEADRKIDFVGLVSSITNVPFTIFVSLCGLKYGIGINIFRL